jgi:Putative transposase of IS4/5 family (DUF4096)
VKTRSCAPWGLCEASVGYCLAIRGPVGLTLLQPRVGEVSFLATISGVHLEDLHQTGRSDTLREGYLLTVGRPSRICCESLGASESLQARSIDPYLVDATLTTYGFGPFSPLCLTKKRYLAGILPSMRKRYQSDLSVAEWAFLKPLLPLQNATGPPKMHSTREILNAVFYIVRGGCCRTSSLQHEDSLPLLSLLALGWEVGEDARRPAQASASSPPEEPLAQRRHRRQSVGQDCRRGWRATWLRRGQEGQRQKAASVGRYPGTSARSADPQRGSPRPRRHQALAGHRSVGPSP